MTIIGLTVCTNVVIKTSISCSLYIKVSVSLRSVVVFVWAKMHGWWKRVTRSQYTYITRHDLRSRIGCDVRERRQDQRDCMVVRSVTALLASQRPTDRLQPSLTVPSRPVRQCFASGADHYLLATWHADALSTSLQCAPKSNRSGKIRYLWNCRPNFIRQIYSAYRGWFRPHWNIWLHSKITTTWT